MNQQALGVLIKLRAEGIDVLDKLIADMDKAGGETTEFKERANQLSQELQRLQAQQELVTAFRQVTQQGRELSHAMHGASADVQRLGTSLQEASAKSSSLISAQTRMAATAQQTQLDIKSMQAALAEYRSGSDKATRSTDEYKASVAQALVTISQLRAELVGQKQQLQATTEAKRVAVAVEKDLQKQYDTSVAAAARMSKQLGENRSAVKSNRDALSALGVETKNLRAAQAEIQQKTNDANVSMQRFGRELKRASDAALENAENNKKVTRSHREIGRGVDSISVQLAALRSQMLGLAGINIGSGMLRDTLATADAYKNLQARMQLVAGEGAALQQAFDGVSAVALRTHSSLETTGQLFTRIAKTGTDAGLGAQEAVNQALELTETINQAVQLSGASAQASDAAITQLIQGLQSGVLRGEEFNSVMEQSPRLAQIMTDSLGVTTGKLRKMAEEGKLTSETVISAIKQQSATVKDEFAKMPLTVGRAIQDLNTNWTLFVGKTDEAKGASAATAKMIDTLAKNLDIVSNSLFSAGKAYVAFKALRMAQNFWEMTKEAAQAASANTQVAATATNAAAGNTKVATTAKQATTAQTGMAAAGRQVAASNQAVAATGQQAAAANAAIATQAGIAGRAKAAFAKAGTQAMGALDSTVNVAMTSVQALVGVLSTLKTFAVISILTNLPEIGRWLGEATAKAMGYGKALRDAEQAVAHANVRMKAQADFLQEYNGLMQAATDKTQGISAAARGMVTEFNAAIKGGKLLKEALDGIQKSLDTSNYQSLHDFEAALRELQRTAKITADQVSDRWQAILSGKEFSVAGAQGLATTAKIFDDLARHGVATASQVNAAWAKALKTEDLLIFEVRLKQALLEGSISVAVFQQALDQGLRESVRRAGKDFDAISGGMGKAATLAVNDLEVIIGNLQRLGAQGVDTGALLNASIGKAINAADSQAAIDAVIAQIESVRNVLGVKVADGFLDQAQQKMRELGDEADRATGGINSLREAMHTLGLKSREDLQRTAAQAQDAYATIKKAGQQEGEAYVAWQQRKSQAAAVMIQRMIEANGNIANASIKAKAAAEGLEIEVDNAGKATVKLANTTHNAANQMSGDYKKMAGDVRGVTQEVDRLTKAQKSAAAAGGTRGSGSAGNQAAASNGTASGSNPVAMDMSWYSKLSEKLKNGSLTHGDMEDMRTFIRTAGQNIEALKAAGSRLSFDGRRSMEQMSYRVREMQAKLEGFEAQERAKNAEKPEEPKQQSQVRDSAPLAQETEHAATTVQAPSVVPAQASQTRTYNINLSGFGTVNTDANGAAAIDALLKQLQQAKQATGRAL